MRYNENRSSNDYYFRGGYMKYSKQREIILKVVKESMDHPNAEVIYEKVKQEIPNISLGTVYRNLNHLADYGLIARISIPGDCDRFDHTIRDHAHFHCIECHKVEDIPVNYISDLKNKVKENTKNEILSYNLVFTGICKDCNRKKDE